MRETKPTSEMVAPVPDDCGEVESVCPRTQLPSLTGHTGGPGGLSATSRCRGQTGMLSPHHHCFDP